MIVYVRFFGPVENFTRYLSPGQRAALPAVELPDGATVSDLLRALRVIDTPGSVRPFVAINGAYQRDDVVLHDGDQIELVPPMGGGQQLTGGTMPKFDYVRPESVSEAIELLNDPAHVSRPLSGGTDLIVDLRYREPNFDRVVDISLLPELRAIRRDGDAIALGASVTFAEVTESALLQEVAPFLVEACRAINGPQIRNMGTIGGNVVNAAADADTLPVLVCLDAVAHVRGPEDERRVPVVKLILGPKRTQLEPGELLTRFVFDVPPPGVRTAFLRVGRRNALAIPRLTMATMGRADAGGLVDFIRIAPGAATPHPMRFTQAEAMLLGQRPTDELFVDVGRQVADTMVSVAGRQWSTEYKARVIAVLTGRALRQMFG